jgi:hypothetical protein
MVRVDVEHVHWSVDPDSWVYLHIKTPYFRVYRGGGMLLDYEIPRASRPNVKP